MDSRGLGEQRQGTLNRKRMAAEVLEEDFYEKLTDFELFFDFHNSSSEFGLWGFVLGILDCI